MKLSAAFAIVFICICLSVADARKMTRTLNGRGLSRTENPGKTLLSLLRAAKSHDNHMPKRANNKRGSCGHASTMTSSQEADSTDAHNTLRRQEGSSDMVKLTYSNDLADRAQEWADECKWKHGLTSMCDGSGIGQNMYMTTGSLDVKSAIQGWYDEKSDYNYDTSYCPSNKMCGHYTQVAWAKSSKVGCGATQCPTVAFDNGDVWYNAVIYVCNYAPAGNYQGEKPFKKGNACSQCPWIPNSGTKCDNGLCAACNPSYDYGCSCTYSSSCNGHGRFDSNQCGCICDTGFYGDECENSCACEDTVGYESACPQWKDLCVLDIYKDFLMGTCKQTCGFCSNPPGVC